mmetsp:Transcript_58326/g.156051  ORF Transcript_58326/g.156051 Transcript_58326/m.156051 type:complete len:238 (-) Transcript_58326:141-854(-)
MVKQDAWIPPYDEWAKESELTHWFGHWRNPKSLLGFDFLYEDGKARFDYPKRDDWGDQEFPINNESDWAKGKKAWEVWLDAYDAWDHETKRLCEVYVRLSEPLDAEEADALYQGKFPLPPRMPAKQLQLFETAKHGDIVRMAEVLEDPDVDVLGKDEKLNTALMYAALGGSLECVEYLVDMGADVTCENSQLDTAFDLAVAAWGERYQEHPVIMFFKNMRAPRGHSLKSKMMSWLSK